MQIRSPGSSERRKAMETQFVVQFVECHVLPLATLLSHATESVAAKTGDAVGGLLNTTLGNLTELVIALTALRAGDYCRHIWNVQSVAIA